VYVCACVSVEIRDDEYPSDERDVVKFYVCFDRANDLDWRTGRLCLSECLSMTRRLNDKLVQASYHGLDP